MCSASDAVTDEIARLQARPVFRRQGIGDDPFVAHFPGDPAARSVQHRAGVFCSVRTEPVNFTGEPVIQIPAYRAAANSTADKLLTIK